MRKMKDSGIEWIGDILENSEITRLKYIGDVFGRIGFRGYTQADLVSEGDGPITLSPSNIGEFGMDYSKCTYLSWDKYDESPEIQIKNGDVLMVKTGSYYGKSAIVEELPIEATINPQLVVIKNISCNPKYLYYYMQTELFKYQVEEAVVGGTIPTIAQEKINAFYIINYDDKYCRRIVEFLDKKCAEIDALIDAKEKTNSLLKEHRQSIIYEAATKGLNPNVPMKDSGVEWIGEIPESWEVCKIKHFAEGEDGVKIGPFGSALTNRLINDGDYNVYSQANLIGADFSKTNHTINEETFTQLNNYEVLPGDICVSMMGTIGKCKVVPDGIKPGIMDSHLIKIRLDSTVNPKFFEYVYDKDNSGVCFVQMKMESKGSIMDGLNSKIVKNLLFPLPPIEEQDFIVKHLEEKCEKIDSLIKLNNIIIDNLKEYRKSIIFEAVTGKVEI